MSIYDKKYSYLSGIINNALKAFSVQGRQLSYTIAAEFTMSVLKGAPDTDLNYTIKLCAIIAKHTKNIPRKDTGIFRAESRSNELMTQLAEGAGIQSLPAAEMLDYGCGDGSISVALGRKLGCAVVHGVDVYDVINNDPLFKYHKNNGTDLNLPLAAASLNLIIALVSLHHVPDAAAVINKFGGLIKPGGIVIIREHDVDMKEFPIKAQFLNMLHVMMMINNVGEFACTNSETAVSWSDRKDDLQKYINSIKYLSVDSFDELFAAAGFARIHKSSYDGYNPQELTYIIYRKKLSNDASQ